MSDSSSSMETESTAPAATQPQVDENGFLVFANGNIKKKILQEGTGATPTDGSEVKVHYVGTLPDGTEFDSSRRRNDAFKFKIGRGNVIKAWDEGVATMKVGEKALLICAPEYAYGANGSPPKIPPNATLHFEVELLDFDDSENVVDDGKIKKAVKRKGEGYQKPADNTTVVYKYRLAVKEASGSKVVEDKWNEETKLVVGDDPATLSGLEESLKNMYKGEHSLFTIHPDYGFGSKGFEKLGIPPNATLLLEIDLLSFDKYKETWDMNTEEKIAYMSKCKEQGNRFFKAGEVKKAGKKYSAAVQIFQYERNLSEGDKKKVDEIKLQCHSNLCVCKAKEVNWEKVISNANDGLAIEPYHLKCLFKRAQAFTHTDRFVEAEEDFKKCLLLDDKNAEILKAHQELKARIKKLKEKERKVFGGLFQKVHLTEDEDQANTKKHRMDVEKTKGKKKKEQQAKSAMDSEPTHPAPAAAAAAAATQANAADQY